MSLPDGFLFSQSSLQDFADCRRRFQLRYVTRLAWPAVETEPVLEAERTRQRGALFHRLVQQHLSGVPAERLSPSIADDALAGWWANYLDFYAKDLAGFQSRTGLSHSEVSLVAGLGDFRVEAKYDLLVVVPDGPALIYDWKTNQNRPQHRWLASRLQTRLYPYLLARAGAPLNGGREIAPEKIEMIYWFAAHPGQPERFAYSAAAYREDEAALQGLIETILRLGEGDFPLTDDLRRCAYCVYRSLCDRGARAGDLDAEADFDETAALDVDFDQIGEIEF